MRGRGRPLIVVVMLCLAPAGALAEAPAPRVELRVEPGAARHLLRLSLVNGSEAPVIVYLDRRLSRVELREGRRALGQCRYPAESLAGGPDERRFVTLEPGQAASEELDLRFPCFGPRLSALDRADLIRVTYQSRFGTDRFGQRVVTGRLGPVEVALPAAASEAAGDGEGDAAAAPAPVQLLRQGPLPDVAQGEALMVPLLLRGPEGGRLVVAVRPEHFSFQVVGPSGRTEECQLRPTRVRPLREFYSRLGQHRMGFDLASVCAPETFSQPGVYTITPRFDAIYDGADVGLMAWTGHVEGQGFQVRVRRAGAGAADPVEIMGPAIVAEGGQDGR